jgi:ubiquinone/menaquinone biosynthesis C-methylase UbiE
MDPGPTIEIPVTHLSYDTLAADYTGQRKLHLVLLRKLRALSASAVSPARILEIGCGTGNFLCSIAALTLGQCFGLEPSSGILELARERNASVSWVQGSAEAVPFPDGVHL